MKRNLKTTFCLLTAFALAFSFVACGGGGGSDAVTYSGSSDPAVADSTTAAALAEYSMGVIEAGIPLGMVFITPPPGGAPTALSAVPLVGWSTSITIPVPAEAVIYGADYGMGGSGSADINGTMTLFLSNVISEFANTWNVDYGVLDGSIIFNNYSIDGEVALNGKATVPYGNFAFSGEAEFSMSDNDFTGDPGLPVWGEVELTFTNIQASVEGESWSLGEGEWGLEEISPGSGAGIYIVSMTVKYEGSTYKLEDTYIEVDISSDAIEAPGAVVPQGIIIIPTETTTVIISGTELENGLFYHPDLGKVWFSGTIYDNDPPDAVTGGSLTFYDAATEANSFFDVFFGYDGTYNSNEGATFYNLHHFVERYFEKGYIINGTFTPDENAPTILL